MGICFYIDAIIFDFKTIFQNIGEKVEQKLINSMLAEAIQLHSPQIRFSIYEYLCIESENQFQ